jgi:hypothetical protein
MNVEIIKAKIAKEKLKELAEASFGDMFKATVDVQQGILTVGGEFHADGEELLIKNGSKQADIWGANIYPFEKPGNQIQYSALINIRPTTGNRSMNIADPLIRQKIKEVVEKLLLGEKDGTS